MKKVFPYVTWLFLVLYMLDEVEENWGVPAPLFLKLNINEVRDKGLGRFRTNVPEIEY